MKILLGVLQLLATTSVFVAGKFALPITVCSRLCKNIRTSTAIFVFLYDVNMDLQIDRRSGVRLYCIIGKHIWQTRLNHESGTKIFKKAIVSKTFWFL